MYNVCLDVFTAARAHQDESNGNVATNIQNAIFTYQIHYSDFFL